ncbi:MAG: uroporphyrinogen-III synthase [Methylococcales bacterium]|nr:uroporphyrinogen-III synthase [Methylococcales bacterium]
MTQRLQGLRILVTRPARQAAKLCDSIAAEGGEVVLFPTLEIVELPPDPQLLKAAAAADWLIFTSANAVDFAIRAFGGKMPELKQPSIATVGGATAKALQQAGCRVDCVPQTEFSSEGLLAESPMLAVGGKLCVIVRGAGGREHLAETLAARGARTVCLEVYKRCLPDADSTELTACIAAGKLDAVTVTSGEALHNLLAMLDKDAIALLRDLPLVVASGRIGRIAGQFGFRQVAVSRRPEDAAILETLTTLFNGENSGRSNRRRTRNSSV